MVPHYSSKGASTWTATEGGGGGGGCSLFPGCMSNFAFATDEYGRVQILGQD